MNMLAIIELQVTKPRFADGMAFASMASNTGFRLARRL